MPYSFQQIQPDVFFNNATALQGQATGAASSMNRMKEKKVDKKDYEIIRKGLVEKIAFLSEIHYYQRLFQLFIFV